MQWGTIGHQKSLVLVRSQRGLHRGGWISSILFGCVCVSLSKYHMCSKMSRIHLFFFSTTQQIGTMCQLTPGARWIPSGQSSHPPPNFLLARDQTLFLHSPKSTFSDINLGLGALVPPLEFQITCWCIPWVMFTKPPPFSEGLTLIGCHHINPHTKLEDWGAELLKQLLLQLQPIRRCLRADLALKTPNPISPFKTNCQEADAEFEVFQHSHSPSPCVSPPIKQI